MRCAFLGVRVNKGKYIISLDIDPSSSTLYLVTNDKNISPHILKNERLGANEAKD
jgi:hypothetical protein